MKTKRVKCVEVKRVPGTAQHRVAFLESNDQKSRFLKLCSICDRWLWHFSNLEQYRGGELVGFCCMGGKERVSPWRRLVNTVRPSEGKAQSTAIALCHEKTWVSRCFLGG